MAYNFSVIIPHKNIPHLLERCLASIPQRDDVQVIVVDDASDPTIVDFGRFPGLKRPHTEVIFYKAPMGQGGSGVARNVGMAEAKGRWLVFADADDFFHPVLAEMMDKYASSDADIVFFRHDSVDSDTLEPVAINTRRNRLLAEFEYTGEEDPLRYMIWVPWGKFVRRALVMERGIGFDPVRFSNNLMFSVRTGHEASKIVSDPAVIYCNTRRIGSLIHEGREDWEAMSQRFDVDYRAARYVLDAGKGRLFDHVVAERWLALARIDPRKARKLVPLLRQVCSPRELRKTRAKLFWERIVRPFRKD
ncbi:MAG: glycosyltransferase family 2 protein [Rikenellaceae bacterium]|jgi:glycosyltransferase involved in cell wall biosynthesis|nr:glycosyltransferase family 2 protein [Rikenellaceae bacterium]